MRRADVAAHTVVIGYQKFGTRIVLYGLILGMLELIRCTVSR